MTQAYTERFTEVHELPGAGLAPVNRAIAAYPTAYVSMANHQRGIFLLRTGVLAAGATVDLQLWQATTAAGAGAKVIAGKAIVQLTQAGGDLNDSALIEVRTEELDVDGGFAFVAGILTIAGNTAFTDLFALYGCSNYPPVAVANWTEVVD